MEYARGVEKTCRGRVKRRVKYMGEITLENKTSAREPEQYGLGVVIDGKDDRKKVEDEACELLPYCAIAYVEMKYGTENYRGTGFMVTPNVMLTAAHNVYDFDEKKECDEFKATVYGKTISCTDWIFCNAYRKDRQCKNDWAAVYVEIPESDSVQTMNYLMPGTEDMPEVSGENAEIAGFPAEAAGIETAALYTEKGEIKEFDNLNKVLEYAIDTSGGNSGSPVMHKRDDGSYWAIGIHNKGVEKKQVNRARAIDGDIKAAIRSLPKIHKRSRYGFPSMLWTYLISLCALNTVYIEGAYGQPYDTGTPDKKCYQFDDAGLLLSYPWCDGIVGNIPQQGKNNVEDDNYAKLYEKSTRKYDDMSCLPAQGIYILYTEDGHIGICNASEQSVIECSNSGQLPIPEGKAVAQKELAAYAEGFWVKWSDIYWCTNK